MRFPWQKEPSEAQKPSTPGDSSTTSSPEHSIEDRQSQDGDRRIIPTAEDEKSSPRTSAERPATAAQAIQPADQTTSAQEKEAGTDLVPTASRATEASSVGEPGEDDESKYPTALPLAILTFGLCLSTFVVALDNTIIGMPKRFNCYSAITDDIQQLPYRKLQQSSIR
jgi:hypothetical protein